MQTSGRLALELANTRLLGPREQDLLAGPGDLERWLRAHEEELGPVPEETLLRLSEFRALRDAIGALLAATVEGRPWPAPALERVNGCAAAVPIVLRLEPGPRVVERPVRTSATAATLAAIARSAVRLLGEGAALGRCRRCGRFFPAGRAGRIWCSAGCGNRARVARHAARRRASRSVG
jgi:predicted RNA-binding Zn ribbon-like protein